MPRVICTLPNASDNINGVAFREEAGVMVSEEISDDLALQFLAIPGYEPNDETPSNPTGEGQGEGQGGKGKRGKGATKAPGDTPSDTTGNTTGDTTGDPKGSDSTQS